MHRSACRVQHFREHLWLCVPGHAKGRPCPDQGDHVAMEQRLCLLGPPRKPLQALILNKS